MVKNAIKVYARLKPERSRKKTTPHEVYERPKKNLDEDFLVLTAPPRICNEYIDNRPESWNFSFFKIFEESVEQEIIFEDVAKPVIHSVLDGYNGTIFAYGQTGSGKTYTITGDQKNYGLRGILPRTLQYLFDITKKHPENLYSVEVSYLEIYNENGYDLLNRKQEWSIVTKLEDLPRVTIQEDETGKLHLKNLSFWSISNEKDALDLLFIGDTNRVVSETPMNPMSSRSHCIFTIIVSVKKFGSDHYSRAKLHLVDLAGSERVYKCAITGTILTEAKHINLSLHYLEQVIVCLGQENTNHIPYRNSLLTAILRDSLGGNCLTTMLATLSLSIENLEETISTCRFAQRVALVRNDVKLILEKNIHSENTLLKMENERLKQQIEMLTKQVDRSARELTADEKKSLDNSVERFLKTEENSICETNPQKLQYCLESLKRNSKLKNFESVINTSGSESIGYYKNLVLQRDKEISLLINMLKKEREKNSRQRLQNDDDKVKKTIQLEENTYVQESTNTINNPPLEKEFKKYNQIPESPVHLGNNYNSNQSIEENLCLNNNSISLTPQEINQLKNIIYMYQEQMLHMGNNYELPVKQKTLRKEHFEAPDNLSPDNLSNTQETKVFKIKDSIHKLPSERSSEYTKEIISINNNLPKSQSNVTLSRSPENNLNFESKNQIIKSSRKNDKNPHKDDKNKSDKMTLTNENLYRDMVTLNLFDVVKDDLRDNRMSERKNEKSEKEKSRHPSIREKQKLKSPNETNSLHQTAEPTSGKSNKNISSTSKVKPIEKSITELQNLVESNTLLINKNFSMINASEGGNLARNVGAPVQKISPLRENLSRERINLIERNAENNEIITSTSQDFILTRDPVMTSKMHLDSATDRSSRSSVNLQSSRSMSSANSQIHEQLTRAPKLSENEICINNQMNRLPFKTPKKSNTEILNSSQGKEYNCAELMHRFQSDLHSSMASKSFGSPKQEEMSFPFSVERESAKLVENPTKDSEKKLLSNKNYNLNEGSSRIKENFFPSARNSFHKQNHDQEKGDKDFEKSLPLTGDPDIDEEIIAFYNAKRAGGTY